MAPALARAAADADAALEHLRAQVAALLAPAAPRTLRSERIVRRRRAPAVLYVDDDYQTASIYGAALREALPGCMVAVVSNADDAIRAARSGSWTAAVLDLHLGHPRLTGLDVLRELPTTTRVVLVTGYLRSELPDVARCAEVDEHLAKPFTVDALACVVRRLVAEPETVTP